MTSEHRRPLLALVALMVLAAFFVARSVEPDSVQEVVRPEVPASPGPELSLLDPIAPRSLDPSAEATAGGDGSSSSGDDETETDDEPGGGVEVGSDDALAPGQLVLPGDDGSGSPFAEAGATVIGSAPVLVDDGQGGQAGGGSQGGQGGGGSQGGQGGGNQGDQGDQGDGAGDEDPVAQPTPEPEVPVDDVDGGITGPGVPAFGGPGPVEVPEPTEQPAPEPAPTVEPVPEPAPTVEPAPEPAPTVEPAPEPAPTVEPAPEPAPTVEPAPEPAPPVEPAPEPAHPAADEPQPSHPVPDCPPGVLPGSDRSQQPRRAPRRPRA